MQIRTSTSRFVTLRNAAAKPYRFLPCEGRDRAPAQRQRATRWRWGLRLQHEGDSGSAPDAAHGRRSTRSKRHEQTRLRQERPVLRRRRLFCRGIVLSAEARRGLLHRRGCFQSSRMAGELAKLLSHLTEPPLDAMRSPDGISPAGGRAGSWSVRHWRGRARTALGGPC